jgi:hypothetical protein
VHCGEAHALLLNVAASSVGVGALLASAWTRSWLPLLGFATLLLLPLG